MNGSATGRTGMLEGISVLWLAAVCGGMGYVIQYEARPGPEASAPAFWPEDTTIPRPTNRPLLLVLAHPRCPCTRASIEELAHLMARAQGHLDARLVFYSPKNVTDDWTLGGFWRAAHSIPGVETILDPDGIESRRFRAETSGHALLYAADGHLLFSGGITRARGHAGDNAGLDAVETLLEGGRPGVSTTPVFGCSLHDPRAAAEETGR